MIDDNKKQQQELMIKKVCSQYKFQMQKSKHKLESKQKFHHKNNNQTIDTNYETIESQDGYEMKNVHYEDFELSPEGKVLIDEDEEIRKKHNDSVHLEIELDDGKVEIIKPAPDDDPLLLAKNFCRINQLDQSMIPILAKNIQKTIEKLIKTKNNQNLRINEKQMPNNRPAKANRVHTEPSIYTTSQHMSSSQILTNGKPMTNHFQSISKQFSKKKIQLQNKSGDYNSASTFNVKVKPLEINNRNSKSTFVKKPKFKSNKKQAQDDSIRTQKFLKTQPNEPFKNNASHYLQENKENQVRQSIYDCLNSNERKKVTKQFYKVEGLVRNNFVYQSKPIKNQQRSVVDRSFQQKRNQNKNESKESQKRKCFVKSIDNSEDKHISLKNHRQSPQVNYSLVNLSTNTNSRNTNQSYHRKQASNSIIYNSSAASSNHVQQTHRLYENQKQKAFKSIFSLLDDDEDGAISIMNINLVDKIQQRLIQVLFPVLEEMQILETELNEQEFIQAMQKLFVKLTVEQKGYLLKYFNKQQQEYIKQNSNTNQPKMSPISLQLVNQTQRRNVTVYEYSKIREQQKKKKLQQQRVEKERSMMRNCTFQPRVNSKKIIYF